MPCKDSYWCSGIERVQGWLEKGIEAPLTAVKDFQVIHAIKGSILEIGVHHGKFFIPLINCTEADEFAVGIDIFDYQSLNVDKSGSGDVEKCWENIKEFTDKKDKVVLIKKDSLSLNTLDKIELLKKYGAFRIISIDGGHTPTHTVNDLLSAQEIMQGGGVLIIDDYYNSHWPGVHEGVGRFFMNFSPKVRIFCYTQNKLFLTDLSHYRKYFSLFQERFSKFPGFKKVRMWDSETIVFNNEQ